MPQYSRMSVTELRRKAEDALHGIFAAADCVVFE
jgi:hypothetical protein